MLTRCRFTVARRPQFLARIARNFMDRLRVERDRREHSSLNARKQLINRHGLFMSRLLPFGFAPASLRASGSLPRLRSRPFGTPPFNRSPGMRVLITRPAADATELAAALRTHGHEVLFDPLLTTSEEPGSAAALERSLPGVQAVVFTSPNGVRAFAAASRRRNIPVITLGDATTSAARAARFGEIDSVDGDAEALTNLVVGRLNPLGGALLVVTGAEVGRDLARVLGAAGFSVRRVALYRAEPAQAFSSKVVAGFKSGTIDAAVFFSPGTATVFARLIAASGFASACEGMTAVVTSQAVGAALKGVSWDNLVVAPAPTQAAILEAFGGPLPQTRPEAPREEFRADEPRPERVDPRRPNRGASIPPCSSRRPWCHRPRLRGCRRCGPRRFRRARRPQPAPAGPDCAAWCRRWWWAPPYWSP